jgi:flagellar biosynthesis protein
MGKTTDTAIALRYDTSLPAPFVVAHGRGDLAKRVIGIASLHGVPVRSEPELAERLIMLEPGSVIPEELFEPVAKILAFVLDLENEYGTSKST